MKKRIQCRQGLSYSKDHQIVFYDNNFFRTFGHNAYQPFFIWLDTQLSCYIFEKELLPEIHYIKPKENSFADIYFSYSGNMYLLESTINHLNQKLDAITDYGSISILLTYPRDPYTSHTYETLGLYTRANMARVYSLLVHHVSVIHAKIASRNLGQLTKNNHNMCTEEYSEFLQLLKAFSKKPISKVALIHVRNALFYGDENLRNSDLLNYAPALKYLGANGYSCVLFAEQKEIGERVSELIINYPILGFKNKRNDYLLCRYAKLLLGTPSGPMFIGDVYSYPSIGIDWWPYDIWPSRSTIVCPRPVRDRSSNSFVSIDEFQEGAENGEYNLLSPPSGQFEVLKSSEQDILEACKSLLEGTAVTDMSKLTKNGSGLVPDYVIKRYNLHKRQKINF